ncbi:MAG: NUDIX hydrolase [Clostridia bacterium]
MFILLNELKNYTSYDNNEKSCVENAIKFLENNENCFDRSNLKGHITAGALVCDNDGNILLNHHKKSGMWFQFGGHSDGEDDSLNVAKREVMEESGITNFSTDGKIFDVAVMEIPFSAKKNEPEHKHYDINFLFIVKDKNYEVSNESMEIKWVTIDEAKRLVDPNDNGMQRMILKYKNFLNNLNLPLVF